MLADWDVEQFEPDSNYGEKTIIGSDEAHCSLNVHARSEIIRERENVYRELLTV